MPNVAHGGSATATDGSIESLVRIKLRKALDTLVTASATPATFYGQAGSHGAGTLNLLRTSGTRCSTCEGWGVKAASQSHALRMEAHSKRLEGRGVEAAALEAEAATWRPLVRL